MNPRAAARGFFYVFIKLSSFLSFVGDALVRPAKTLVPRVTDEVVAPEDRGTQRAAFPTGSVVFYIVLQIFPVRRGRHL